MDTVIKEQLLRSNNHFKSGEYRESLKILNGIPDHDEIYVKLNKCILLDRQNRDDELIGVLDQVTKWLIENECNDDQIWWAAAFLNHKIQRPKEAIFCIDRLLKLSKKTDVNIDAVIRKGFCLESLYGMCLGAPDRVDEFDQAIDLFHELLNDKPIVIYKYLPEIYHGLGHFYNERGNIKKSISDINKAKAYMKEAARINPMYCPCWGTIYSENKNYQRSLEIFDEALKRPDISDNIKKEILFYKAEALSWVGNYSKAYELFEQFENYCEKHNNKDGKVHSIVYRIETQLRERSILEIRLNEIESWINLLNEKRPSHYANMAIHDEWEKLIHLLNGLYNLKQCLQDNSTIEEVYDKIIDELKHVVKNDLMMICLSDNSDKSSKNLGQFNFKVILGDDGKEDSMLLDNTDVILMTFFESIPIGLIFLAQKKWDKGNTLILWYDKHKVQMYREIEKKTLIFDDLQNAIKVTFLLSVYDEIKKNLVRPFFLFGMAPISSAQSGWIGKLIIPGDTI